MSKSALTSMTDVAANSALKPQSLVERFAFMLRVRRERQALQGLDDATLKDIGLSRGDVEREGSRSLLDLPAQSPFDRRYKI
jgi:uncharacterized protein YjiS (DUF1127 family)